MTQTPLRPATQRHHGQGARYPMTAAVTEPWTTTAQQLYYVHEVVPILRLSRSVIYELIRSGRLRTVKQGRSRRVPASAIADYIALLETEAAQEADR